MIYKFLKNEKGYGGVMLIFVLIFSMLFSLILTSIFNWEISLLREEVLDAASKSISSNTHLFKKIEISKCEDILKQDICKEVKSRIISSKAKLGGISNVFNGKKEDHKVMSDKLGRDTLLGVDANVSICEDTFPKMYRINFEINLRIPFYKFFILKWVNGDNVEVFIKNKSLKLNRYFLKISNSWSLYP